MAVFLSQRYRIQPPGPIRPGLVKELGLSSVYVPWSKFQPDTLIGEAVSVIGLTHPEFDYGVRGKTVRFTAPGQTQAVRLAADADSVLETDRCSVMVFRRHRDTTNRNAVIVGYNNSGTDVAWWVAPWGDGNTYWDFGNSTAGSGRVSAAWGTKSLEPEVSVAVAGPRKGREIWRAGRRLVSDTAATATRAATTAGWHVGAHVQVSDAEEVYLAMVSRREWTDSEISELTRNPWLAFQQPRMIFLGAQAAAGGGSTRSRFLPALGVA